MRWKLLTIAVCYDDIFFETLGNDLVYTSEVYGSLYWAAIGLYMGLGHQCVFYVGPRDLLCVV